MLMQCKSLRYLTFKSMHRLFDNCIKLRNGISVVQNIFIYTHASYHRNSRLLFDFMMFIFPMKWHMIAFFFCYIIPLFVYSISISTREEKKKFGKKNWWSSWENDWYGIHTKKNDEFHSKWSTLIESRLDSSYKAYIWFKHPKPKALRLLFNLIIA